jgi:hypothetical protein
MGGMVLPFKHWIRKFGRLFGGVKMKLKIKRLEDVTDDEMCSVDPSYDIQGVSAMVASHNSGAVDITKECWFGYKDNYQFAPRSTIAMVVVNEA